MNETSPPSADLTLSDAEDALLDGAVDAVAAPCSSTQRPLQGLAGRLDWRMGGALSRAIRAGAITGAPGEIAYVPFERQGRVMHVLLVGAGPVAETGQAPLPTESTQALKRNLASLGLRRVGLSRAEFHESDRRLLAGKGSPACLVK